MLLISHLVRQSQSNESYVLFDNNRNLNASGRVKISITGIYTFSRIHMILFLFISGL